jgi:hypothetical protein
MLTDRLMDIMKLIVAFCDFTNAPKKRDEMKGHTMKRKRLLWKYNTEKKENLDQMIEVLKQKVSANMKIF